MEIAPISGIRVRPVIKTPSNEREISAVFDIDSLMPTGDDSYTGSGRQTSGGQDDDSQQDQTLESETKDEKTGQETARDQASGINFVV
jgi:hypothetical protein